MYKSDKRYVFLFISSLLANFLVSFNNMAMNVALPSLVRIFDISYNIAQWSISIFVLAICFTMPVVPYLTKLIGTAQTLLVGMCIFTFGTILGSIPDQGFPLLISARFIMGLAGGLLIPVSMMIVYEVFPPEKRGSMMGIWGIVVSIAPALGPAFSGVVLGFFSSYTSLFFVNIPFIVIMFCLFRVYPNQHKIVNRFDTTGYLLLIIGLIACLYGTTKIDSSALIGLIIICFGFLSLFIYFKLARKSDVPILSVHILKNPIFSHSLILVAIATFSQYSLLVLTPILIVEHMGLSELYAGLFMIPYALISGFYMSVGGKELDKKGAPSVLIKGILIMAIGSIILGFFTTIISLFLVGACLHAVGWGLMSMPSTTAGLNGLNSNEVSDGSAFSNLWRQMFRALSVVILIHMYNIISIYEVGGISFLFILFGMTYLVLLTIPNRLKAYNKVKNNLTA